MKNRRLLFGVMWLASLVIVFFAGTFVGGDRRRDASTPPQDHNREREGASPGEPATFAGRDRTMRRSMDQLEEVGKKEKADVPRLIAQARLQIGNVSMMNIRGMLRAIAPLVELDQEQIQEALGEVERSVKEPQQRTMLYMVLLSQWAESDGQAALAYADEKLGKEGPFDMGVKGQILAAWASSNPDGAWAWYQSQSKESLSDSMAGGNTLSTLFSGMAAKDLDSALQRMATLDDAARATALNGIASIAGDSTGRDRLLDRAASLPAEQRTQIYRTVAVHWAMADPQEMVKWMRSLPVDERRSIRASAENTLMMARPELGAEVVLEQADPSEKPRAYERVASYWASRDAKAAGEWLMKQPQGPELDGARGSFARAVASKDPAAAMDWAKSMHAEDERFSTVEHVYQVWRMKDGSAADAALDASGLPKAKIQELKEASTESDSSADERHIDVETYFRVK